MSQQSPAPQARSPILHLDAKDEPSFCDSYFQFQLEHKLPSILGKIQLCTISPPTSFRSDILPIRLINTNRRLETPPLLRNPFSQSSSLPSQCSFCDVHAKEDFLGGFPAALFFPECLQISLSAKKHRTDVSDSHRRFVRYLKKGVSRYIRFW